MTDDESDPSRAAVRVAESVVALARAELDLVVAEARVSAGRLVTRVALTVAAVYASALAVVIVVVSPMLWALRPSAAIATVAIALFFAGVSWVVALTHSRAREKSKSKETPGLLPAHPTERDHAVTR